MMFCGSQSHGAVLFEISLGRCGILLLCHLLGAGVRASLTDYFHTKCTDPYIVAVVAHKAETRRSCPRARRLVTRPCSNCRSLAEASGSVAFVNRDLRRKVCVEKTMTLTRAKKTYLAGRTKLLMPSDPIRNCATPFQLFCKHRVSCFSISRAFS
jgi:hypothetical protein